jgi:hypothetical protein
VGRDIGPARHERPAIDEAALVAARDAERALESARDRGMERWATFLENIPDRLRDAPINELRGVAMGTRPASGPRAPTRAAAPAALAEPLLDHVDRLLKLLAREERTR